MSSPVSESTHVSAFVNKASELDAVLSAAVDRVRLATPGNQSQGVLVTAHAPGAFVVTLSHEVPYGLTRECYAY